MSKRYLFGIILILLGIGFLLEQLNIIYFGEIISMYWPSILILIGLVGLFDKKTSKFGNLILILIGSALQINRLDIVDINLFQLFWPVVLILVGINILFSRKSESGYKKSGESGENERSFDKNISLEDTVDEFVIMGGIETINQSENFKGGKITAIMAGVEMDLRRAKLYNNKGFLEIKAVMGGVELTIPEGWRVEVKGTPIAGGFSNKTRFNNDPNAPVLKIDYIAIFGGIEVK